MPSAMSLSSTYTGQPKTWARARLSWERRLPVQSSEGQMPEETLGRWLKIQTAYRMAKGHSLGLARAGQWMARWRRLARAHWTTVLMLRSATPFWNLAWGALKLCFWCWMAQSDLKAAEAKVPLSEWYLLMEKPLGPGEALEEVLALDGFGGVGGELGVD